MVVVDEHCKSSRQERHEATTRPSRTKQCTSAWRKCGFWCQLNQSSAQGLQSKCWNCTSHRAQPERALAAGLREEGRENEGGKNVHRYVFSAIWTPCTGGPDGSALEFNAVSLNSAPVLLKKTKDLKYRSAIAIPTIPWNPIVVCLRWTARAVRRAEGRLQPVECRPSGGGRLRNAGEGGGQIHTRRPSLTTTAGQRCRPAKIDWAEMDGIR